MGGDPVGQLLRPGGLGIGVRRGPEHGHEDLGEAHGARGAIDLRHEGTSRLFEKSLGLMEVASITGHKTLQVFKRYKYLRADDLVGRLG